MRRLALLTIIAFTMVLVGPAMVMSGPPPTPFQGFMSWSRDGSEEPEITPLSPTPPPDKILTIEYISGECLVNEEALDFTVAVRTSFDESEYLNYLIPVLVNTITNTSNELLHYVFSQKILIFADTDNSIEPAVGYSFVYWPSAFCNFSVSGQLKN